MRKCAAAPKAAAAAEAAAAAAKQAAEDEVEKKMREFAARFGVNLDVEGEEALMEEAGKLFDRTLDEVEKMGQAWCIDAQGYGNVARFINHSCDPNLQKQVVFVDTHDVRLPRVAFFAMRDIPAYEELTYDYSYMDGTVENRSMECLCGAEGCRKVMY